MKMHVLSGGKLRMSRRIYIPDADRNETIDLPVSCYLIRHAEANVLFDTGCHPQVASDPEERWGDLSKVIVPLMAPGDDVLQDLGRVGLSPDDIDVVVNSHLHCDHCGCNEFFKRATFFVHDAELETAGKPENEGRGYFRADWDHPMPLDRLTGERDIFDDGRIVLVPLPGHSPGLTAALVGLDRDGAFLLASDAVNLRSNLDNDVAPKNTWQPDLLHRSYEEMRRIEAGGVTVVCGHDAAQMAQMKNGADYYQ